jgi:hypothetical protein
LRTADVNKDGVIEVNEKSIENKEKKTCFSFGI